MKPDEPLRPIAPVAASPACLAEPVSPRTAVSPARRFPSEIVKTILARYGLLVAFLITVVGFGLARPATFPTAANAKSIVTLAAPSLIIAAGLTVVLVMQDFDLSFGAMIGFGGGAAVSLMAAHGWPWELTIVVALGCGVAAGLANGYLIAYLGGSSFIITLAMGSALSGFEYVLTHQKVVYQGVATGYSNIASGTLFGLSNQIWIAGAIALLVWILLDRSELGRYMYAIGGNPEAARLSGVRVRPLRVFGFVIVGLSAAVVGILITSQGASYYPDQGLSYLLPAFAAAFLGSAVFRPGEFNLPGTAVGVLFLGVIQTGLTMVNFQTYAINLVQAAILISAVLVSRLGGRSA